MQVRAISTLVCVVIVANLFYLGSKPVAVGLFPSPIDKVAHFATFALIAALLGFGLLRHRPWVLLIVASSIAGADEIHQMFLPGRSADILDFLTDIVAIGLVALVFRLKSRAQ